LFNQKALDDKSKLNKIYKGKPNNKENETNEDETNLYNQQHGGGGGGGGGVFKKK
jgi:hypothetical protein